MGQLVSGFQLPEGVTASDLDTWPPFAEWFKEEYGFMPQPSSTHDKAIFEAWLAGAYWEVQGGLRGECKFGQV